MAPEFECGSCGVVFEKGDEPEHAPSCEYVDLVTGSVYTGAEAA